MPRGFRGGGGRGFRGSSSSSSSSRPRAAPATNLSTAVAAGAAGSLAASLGLGALFGGRPMSSSDLAAATLGAGAGVGLSLLLTRNPRLAQLALRNGGRAMGRAATQPARKLSVPSFTTMAGAGAAGGFVGLSLNGGRGDAIAEPAERPAQQP